MEIDYEVVQDRILLRKSKSRTEEPTGSLLPATSSQADRTLTDRLTDAARRECGGMVPSGHPTTNAEAGNTQNRLTRAGVKFRGVPDPGSSGR